MTSACRINFNLEAQAKKFVETLSDYGRENFVLSDLDEAQRHAFVIAARKDNLVPVDFFENQLDACLWSDSFALTAQQRIEIFLNEIWDLLVDEIVDVIEQEIGED